MIEKFFKKEHFLTKAVGAIAVIGALFLNIPIPEDKEIWKLLANVQVFWLLILAVLLLILFVRFVKYLIKVEKGLQNKYSLHVIGTLSITIGSILIFIIGSLLGYIAEFYSESLSSILKITFPGVVMAGILFLDIFVAKRKKKFTYFSMFVIESFSISVLVAVAGAYIQELVIGYFYHWWFYLVLPISFSIFFISLIVLALIKAKGKGLFDLRN